MAERKTVRRKQQILERLRAVPQEWRVEELARAMHVSPLTIRRDLEALEQQGLIVRTIGGCLAVWRMHHADYQARIAKNFELKQAIGRAAAREVRAGQTILLNDGSTTYHLASQLGSAGSLMVYTNSIAMISELRRFENVRIHVLGGELDRRLSYLSGALLHQALEMVAADIVFIGADAIDAQGRCLTFDQETARTARLMLKHGRRRILLADHTKYSAAGGVVYAQLRDFDTWITTRGLPAPIERSFSKMTQIIQAEHVHN